MNIIAGNSTNFGSVRLVSGNVKKIEDLCKSIPDAKMTELYLSPNVSRGTYVITTGKDSLNISKINEINKNDSLGLTFREALNRGANYWNLYVDNKINALKKIFPDIFLEKL